MCATEQRDVTNDDLTIVLARVVNLTHNQRRLELDIRRVGLDVQRLDATMQLMGTSVSALSDDVKELGTYVRRLETKLDLNRQLMDFHLHTIMSHIGVPLPDTFHSRLWDGQSSEDRPSPPGEVGG